MTEPASTRAGWARTVRVHRSGRDARGAAAAEVAAVLPVLTAVVVVLVWMVSLAATHIRVVDAAREVARAAARSDATGPAVALGRTVAPEGAQISVERQGGRVVVRVRCEVRGPSGVFSLLPAPTVTATATSAQEDR